MKWLPPCSFLLHLHPPLVLQLVVLLVYEGPLASSSWAKVGTACVAMATASESAALRAGKRPKVRVCFLMTFFLVFFLIYKVLDFKCCMSPAFCEFAS